jgi:hypothetical protein
MSLNSAIVYRRTDRGLREVYEKSYQFTQSERLVLILLDGRLDVAGLRARLPSLDNERIERTIVKLEEAGLVEPTAPTDQSASPAEEVMRLEPEIVAHFLEQSDLDPGTASSANDVSAAELVRASVERAAAELVREDAVATASPSPDATFSDSGRSPRTAPQPSPFDDPEWNPTEATSFAITTVNVPDRLDMQEERDRVEMEEYSGRLFRFGLEKWMKRLLVAAVVVVAGAVLYGVVRPLRDAASPTQVAQRLTEAFKRPVTVADTEFHLMPSPRLVLRRVDVGGAFAAEQVALLIHWKDLWLALNGGSWAWGQATIAPMAMSTTQALAAVRALPAAAPSLPASISSVRFESVQLPGSLLFPGRYEATLRRTDKGGFGPLAVRRIDQPDSAMQFTFRPSSQSPGATDFAFEAQGWAAPVGPRGRWNEVRASGRVSDNLLEVSNYFLGGYYGITTGTLFVAGDVEWVVTGTVEAANIDVETVLRSLPASAGRLAEGVPTPMQGTATMKLIVVGRGATAEEAVARSLVAGPFNVRFAVLNGINLGLAATQGAAAAGLTRFTEFGGTVVASSNGVRFEDTGGRAGAMHARSDFTVAPDASIAGAVRVELGGQRVQAPINMRITGTAAQPRFGR